jgi:hypothetical protein
MFLPPFGGEANVVTDLVGQYYGTLYPVVNSVFAPKRIEGILVVTHLHL